MSNTKSKIKLNKRLAELLHYLASDNLAVEYERVEEGDSDFTEAELDELGTLLEKFERMIDGDVITLLGHIVIKDGA